MVIWNLLNCAFLKKVIKFPTIRLVMLSINVPLMRGSIHFEVNFHILFYNCFGEQILNIFIWSIFTTCVLNFYFGTPSVKAIKFSSIKLQFDNFTTKHYLVKWIHMEWKYKYLVSEVFFIRRILINWLEFGLIAFDIQA